MPRGDFPSLRSWKIFLLSRSFDLRILFIESEILAFCQDLVSFLISLVVYLMIFSGASIEMISEEGGEGRFLWLSGNVFSSPLLRWKL